MVHAETEKSRTDAIDDLRAVGLHGAARAGQAGCRGVSAAEVRVDSARLERLDQLQASIRA